MSQLPMILELGVGSALRSGSYTKAACRAVRDALWRNSINLVEVFGADKSSMQIMAEICLLYTSPSPRDVEESRMPSSA